MLKYILETVLLIKILLKSLRYCIFYHAVICVTWKLLLNAGLMRSFEGLQTQTCSKCKSSCHIQILLIPHFYTNSLFDYGCENIASIEAINNTIKVEKNILNYHSLKV